jgi:uncharacterized protein YneF (UPF0154 family)
MINILLISLIVSGTINGLFISKEIYNRFIKKDEHDYFEEFIKELENEDTNTLIV